MFDTGRCLRSMLGGSKCEYDEKDNTVALKGTDYGGFWASIYTNLGIMALITTLCILTGDEDRAVFIGAIIVTLTSILRHFRESQAS